MTGETLTTSTKNNLFAYAKEYGIKEEQILVKEYVTKNIRENDDMFKGIYEKLDSEIDKHEQTIEELTKALQEAKQDELPYMQLANEIAVSYPEIKQIYMGQGAQITLDSLSVSSCVMVKVETDSLMNETSLSQLKRWIQVRLQIENIEIQNSVN